MAVVEVISRSSRAVDSGTKLTGYFGLESVRHYLVLDADKGSLAHHRPDEGGQITTQVVRGGSLRLDPPGLDLALDRLSPD